MFPQVLTSIGFYFFLDDSHSDWSEVESQCHFDLHFPAGSGC
jgi:hypothetical protein